MDETEFEHEPLRKIVEGLTASHCDSNESLRQSLADRGYDLDKLSRNIESKIKKYSKETRLAWMHQAEINQNKLNVALANVLSWLNKPVQEIEIAFNQVKDGTFGEAAQLRLQTAFRNVESLPPKSKAAFLDEIDVLLKLTKEAAKEQ